MGNRFKKSELSAEDRATIAEHYNNYMVLMKLRKRGATRMSKLPKGVFGRILEYCEPIITKRVTDHQYKGSVFFTSDYTWPEQVSYQNPVVGLK